MNLFYTDREFIASAVLTLEGQEAFHASKVMRCREGDQIVVTDGEGSLYKGSVLKIEKNRVSVQIHETVREEIEKPFLTLCLGFIKKRDRLEFAVEKAVELGVNEIVIFKGDHSLKGKVREERLQAAALSAMKQSLRTWLPMVRVEKSLRSVLKNLEKNIVLVVADETTAGNRKGLIRSSGKTVLIVGPEGGFSAEERCLIEEKQATHYSLGRKRLRAETAAVAMVDRFRNMSEH